MDGRHTWGRQTKNYQAAQREPAAIASHNDAATTWSEQILCSAKWPVPPCFLVGLVVVNNNQFQHTSTLAKVRKT